MFYSIRCYRGEGRHRVNDAVISNLLSELPACIQRGRNELDESAHGSQLVTIEMVFRPGIRLGQLVKVQETLFGSSWYAKITGIKHHVQNAKLTTELTLLKPTDFFVGTLSAP